MPGPVPPESTASRIGFGADLACAARALISQPSVPLVSLAVMLLVCGDSRSGHDSDVRSVVGIASMFFLAGWYGVERVFFQRHLQASPLAALTPAREAVPGQVPNARVLVRHHLHGGLF